MTSFKCPQCGARWSEGPTRDHQEGAWCRTCIQAENDRFREALREGRGWIKCSEHLPVGEEPVLIYYAEEALADNLIRLSTSNPEYVRQHWQGTISHWAPQPPPAN